jgi:hypothetical protein
MGRPSLTVAYNKGHLALNWMETHAQKQLSLSSENTHCFANMKRKEDPCELKMVKCIYGYQPVLGKYLIFKKIPIGSGYVFFKK